MRMSAQGQHQLSTDTTALVSILYRVNTWNHCIPIIFFAGLDCCLGVGYTPNIMHKLENFFSLLLFFFKDQIQGLLANYIIVHKASEPWLCL